MPNSSSVSSYANALGSPCPTSLSSKIGVGKSKAGMPPGKLQQSEPRPAAVNPQQEMDSPINVRGVVTIEALVSEFRTAMEELLDERLVSMVVELEDLKSTCASLDNRLRRMEEENRQLKETVSSLSSALHPPLNQPTDNTSGMCTSGSLSELVHEDFSKSE